MDLGRRKRLVESKSGPGGPGVVQGGWTGFFPLKSMTGPLVHPFTVKVSIEGKTKKKRCKSPYLEL